MSNKNESIIQTLNKFAWIISLVLGIVWIIEGIVAITAVGLLCTGLTGIYQTTCQASFAAATGTAVWWFIAAVLAIIGGIIAKMKCVGEIAAGNFSTVSMTLLIAAIIGCIGDGAGIVLLVQFILIKVGEK
ncbi:MAG TPA: hypothetical protein VKK79_03245 [Candidatus Lokiarchaeia archaeon]|nr:hypothetical protein [Candidatus Lokiarchaeia archaeon]